MIKSFTKLLMVSKKIFPSSRYIVTTQLYYSNQQVDIIKRLENEKNSDKAINKFKIDDINFKLLINNNRIDCNYTIKILKSMQRLYEKNGIPLLYLIKSEAFLKISFILNKHLRKLELNETINLLNVLNSIQVPSSSIIMESLLQLIRLSINNLSLREIYFLTSILTHMEPTHLNHAIRIALAEVFKAQVQFQLNTENIQDLIKAFIYSSQLVNNETILEFIISEINKNKGLIDLNSSVVILLRLMKPQTVSHHSLTPLLNRVSNIVIDKTFALNNSAVMAILKNLHSQILQGHYTIYNSILIDKLINVSIVQNYGLQQWLNILYIINSIRHVNIPLLEHLSNYFYEYPTIFAKFNPTGCLHILSGLACANYKPPLWNELRKLFLNYIKLPDDTLLYSFAIDLAALNCYDSNILQQIFTDFKITKVLTKNTYRLIYRLYYSVKILYPTYSGPWPSNEVIQFFKDWKSQQNQWFDFKQSNFPLLPTLEKLVGGSDYVSNNVKTNEIDEPIDHLILLQYKIPVNMKSVLSLNNNSTSNTFHNIEDFIISSNTERVAIILLKSKTYSRNNQILQPFDLLRIKILEQMSYKVVPVFEDIWKTMSNGKQLLYLQSLIKVKN